MIAVCTTVSAQNVIVNGDFESNPPPNFGNNIGWAIAPWVLGAGSTSNAVKVDGPGAIYNYGTNGPESDASAPGAGVAQHYLDIASGANDFYQSFTPRCSGMVTFGGSFSTRGNLAGTAQMTLREGIGILGAVVAGSGNITLPGGNSQFDPWTPVNFAAAVTANATYSLVVRIDNNLNFDNGFATYQFNCCGTASIGTWNPTNNYVGLFNAGPLPSLGANTRLRVRIPYNAATTVFVALTAKSRCRPLLPVPYNPWSPNMPGAVLCIGTELFYLTQTVTNPGPYHDVFFNYGIANDLALCGTTFCVQAYIRGQAFKSAYSLYTNALYGTIGL